jgi:hypothetical protein
VRNLKYEYINKQLVFMASRKEENPVEEARRWMRLGSRAAARGTFSVLAAI